MKDDAGATYDEVGDVINYTIVATNIGNVTLKGVVVTDPNVTDLVCTPATPVDLAPGESIECTASHTVTQEDLDNGVYLNTACANDTDGPAAEVCDDEDTPGEQNPALAIDKTVAETLFDEVGQVLHYTIVVTNVGNVTLHNVVVTDPLVSDLDCEPDLPVPSLAVGASFTCTATYTIVEADFDPLVVTNVACADDGMGDGEVGADPVCDTVQTPGQELEEETDAPTLPPTDGVSGSNNSAPGGGAWLLVIGLGDRALGPRLHDAGAKAISAISLPRHGRGGSGNRAPSLFVRRHVRVARHHLEVSSPTRLLGRAVVARAHHVVALGRSQRARTAQNRTHSLDTDIDVVLTYPDYLPNERH